MVDAPRIVPVATPRERERFIALPWLLHRGRPHWTAPPRFITRHILDQQRNPFWRHAEGALFLALRNNRPVGRISAQIDQAGNDLWHDRIGSFGFFECTDDHAAAAALFDAAATWLRVRGMRVMRGPMSPSMNAECGFLTEGFDHPPAFMMAYTPAYYAGLADACGFARVHDIVSYSTAADVPLPPVVNRVAARLRRDPRIRIRAVTRRTVDADAALLCTLFNECWAENWGFAPVSLEEVRAMVQTLKHIGHQETTLIVYVGEVPVGAYIAMPDLNQVLTTRTGRVTPALCWRWLLRRWYLTRSRTFLFGIRAPYRRHGLAVLMYHAADQFLRQRYQEHEFGWVLDDNQPAHEMMAVAGARIRARYTIVERPLNP